MKRGRERERKVIKREKGGSGEKRRKNNREGERGGGRREVIEREKIADVFGNQSPSSSKLRPLTSD